MMYYFANGMEQRGPYSLEELSQFGLRPDTLVWREGMANWQRMDTVPELMALIPNASVAPATAPPAENLAEPTPASAPEIAPLEVAPAWQAPKAPVGYASAPNYAIQYQSAIAAPPASGLAIASLVLGIVSLLSVCLFHVGAIVGLPCAIMAIVFGVLAKPKINTNEMSGRGMALAGIICGSIYLALVVLVVIIALVFIAVSIH